MSKKRNAFIWLGAVLALVCIQWYFSGMDGTASQSQSDFLMTLLSIPLARPLIVLVRKSAHFLMYMTQGICLYGSFSNLESPKPVLSALLCGILLASLDETHQYFVPGRSAQVIDVLVDSAGLVCGIFIFWIIQRLNQRKKA